MRFLTSVDDFDKRLRLLDSLVVGREISSRQSYAKSFSYYLFISFSSIFNRVFFNGLTGLSRAGEGSFSLWVSDPDPVRYAREFGRYNAVDFERGDSSEEYIAALNEAPPRGNSADSLVDSSNRLYFFSESRKWLMMGDRGVNLTYCFFSDRKTMADFKEAYAGAFFADATAAEEFSLETTGNVNSLASFV